MIKVDKTMRKTHLGGHYNTIASFLDFEEAMIAARRAEKYHSKVYVSRVPDGWLVYYYFDQR